MATRIKDMTQGMPMRLLISFSMPLMLGNVFQQMYTVVDTIVVGKTLGVSALAALGAADWLNWMMLSIIQGLTQGFGILIAKEFGARRYDSLKQVVGHSLMLSLLLSGALLALGQGLALPMLKLLQTPQEILEDALQYLRIMFWGVPVVMAYNLLACVLRALGNARTPLNAMIVASFTNIGLDVLFVVVFGWGIAGAAIATVIAQLVSGVFCLVRILKVDILKLKSGDFRLSGRMSKELMLLGTPVALQNAMISVGGLIVQTVVNGFGVIFIAGFTAASKLYGVLEIAATSYGYAMITYAGQNLGAGRVDRIRQGMKAANLVAVVTSALIALVMLVFGKVILGMFISGTPEEVEQAMKVAYRYLSTMSICLPVLYILHVMRSAIQGMGNTVLPMASGVAEFVMRATAAILLPLAVGESGIFYAEILAWLGADAVLIPSYFFVIRRLNRK